MRDGVVTGLPSDACRRPPRTTEYRRAQASPPMRAGGDDATCLSDGEEGGCLTGARRRAQCPPPESRCAARGRMELCGNWEIRMWRRKMRWASRERRHDDPKKNAIGSPNVWGFQRPQQQSTTLDYEKPLYEVDLSLRKKKEPDLGWSHILIFSSILDSTHRSCGFGLAKIHQNKKSIQEMFCVPKRIESASPIHLFLLNQTLLSWTAPAHLFYLQKNFSDSLCSLNFRTKF